MNDYNFIVNKMAIFIYTRPYKNHCPEFVLFFLKKNITCYVIPETLKEVELINYFNLSVPVLDVKLKNNLRGLKVLSRNLVIIPLIFF